MRRLINFILLLFLVTMKCTANAALNGNIEYNIPIDYSVLNREELENKASFYFALASKTSNGKLNEDITSALNLYTILVNKSPENILYLLRLGILYDLCGKDRYAKSSFYKAISIDNTKPEPFFYLGEFFYKKAMYRKALNLYSQAYKKGYECNYETLYKMGDIYYMLGDTSAALIYLQKASELNSNSVLDEKIKRVKISNTMNKAYYSNTRIKMPKN